MQLLPIESAIFFIKIVLVNDELTTEAINYGMDIFISPRCTTVLILALEFSVVIGGEEP